MLTTGILQVHRINLKRSVVHENIQHEKGLNITKLTSGDFISGKAGTSMGGNCGKKGTLSCRSLTNTKLSSLSL